MSKQNKSIGITYYQANRISELLAEYGMILRTRNKQHDVLRLAKIEKLVNDLAVEIAKEKLSRSTHRKCL